MVTLKSAKYGIAEIVSALYEVRQQKAAFEKTEKVLLDELKPLVDPILDAQSEHGGGTMLSVGALSVFRVRGTSRSVSADLLLERGVAAEIINFATRTTTYFQYRIKEAKS